MAVVVALVVATGFALGPTFRQHQKQSTEPPVEKRAWQMPELIGKTQTELIGRFGPPLSTKDYSLQEGIVCWAGHRPQALLSVQGSR